MIVYKQTIRGIILKAATVWYLFTHIKGLSKIRVIIALLLYNVLKIIIKGITAKPNRLISKIEQLFLDKLFKCTVILYGRLFIVRNIWDFGDVHENYEKDTTELLKNLEGDIFVDIGAHIGRYTILLSKNFELVLSIEADPQTFAVLEKNIEINKINNVIAVCAAITDSNGLCILNRPQKCLIDFGKTSVNNKFKRVYPPSIIVPTISLDNLIFSLNIDPKRISVIKIDVEGKAYDVVQGAENVLKEGSPLLIIELWKEEYEKVVNKLKILGYKLVRKLDNMNYLFAKKV